MKMADKSKVREFPDVNNKLAAPSKKSVFEKQKAEAEAKRLREEAETAAVYEDFVKSFEDEEINSRYPSGPGRPGVGGAEGLRRGAGGSGIGGGPPKRHFTGSQSGKTGRGGLPLKGPGSLGPVSGVTPRKRAEDSYSEGKSAFAQDEDDQPGDDASKAEATSKPTMRLSSMPLGTSPAAVKSLLPNTLQVDSIRMLPPNASGPREKHSATCIVTLSADTPSSEIDAAVNLLQNKYLGKGGYLSISRHLSSAALSSDTMQSSGVPSSFSSLPFGARAAKTGPANHTPRGAPPPSLTHRGGYAPPASYAPGAYSRGGAPPVQVFVHPPAELKEIRLIHKTLQALATHGPEFEALLMSRPEVQREEKWAWLWDARSPGGIWYRWRLWQILSSTLGGPHGRDAHSVPHFQHVFDGGAPWTAPNGSLRYEYTTSLEDFVSDSDYNSSEDEDSDIEDRRRQREIRGAPGLEKDSEEDTRSFLNPLKKSKLTHLLARLPTTIARLRKGDVARITAFAIENSGAGVEEVVDMIVMNVEQPFARSAANPEWKIEHDALKASAQAGSAEDKDKVQDREDPSSAKLIGLYIISDILSSSSTSGARHAWRYRQMFESNLKQRKTFEGLGRLEKELQWGRLRAEKWRRSVNGLLSLWEGWCVFPQASHEHFVSVFTSPPLTAAEEFAAATTGASDAAAAAKSRWKTVDVGAREKDMTRPVKLDAGTPFDAVESSQMDIDGDTMPEDEDMNEASIAHIDGEPMDEEELRELDSDGEDAVSQAEAPGSGVEQKDNSAPPEPEAAEKAEASQLIRETSSAEPGRRSRPKAEDMFADSDGE